MIYYTMIRHKYQLQFNNQLQSVTVSSELQNKGLNNFYCRCQLGNKDSKYSFKQNILNFTKFLRYNFSKDEMFEEKHSQVKILDFYTLPKHNSSGFFLSIKFCIKRNLVTEYCNLQQNIVYYHVNYHFCYSYLYL